MKKWAYYNDNDPAVCAWVRELIADGLVADGVVDERPIEDVSATDLVGFTQCHFFCGIAVWSLALRRAGWSDDRPVWTGSCPCQPFSGAGKGGGTDDKRHLWPHLFRLIAERRPLVCFGEQVASSLGLAWLDAVQADLEGADYACGAVDTCAAGFGAPHWRQRLYWVADADAERLPSPSGRELRDHEHHAQSRGDLLRMAYPTGSQLQGHSGRALRMDGGREALRPSEREAGAVLSGSDGEAGGLGNAFGPGQQPEPDEPRGVPSGVGAARCLSEQLGEAGSGTDDTRRPGPVNGLWRHADWLACRDGKWRPVEGGTFPLAPGRAAVGSVESRSRTIGLEGAGNALNLAQAEEFVRAYMDVAA